MSAAAEVVDNECIPTTNDGPVPIVLSDDSPKKNMRPVKTVLYEGLQEKDVGITEYTTSTLGMSGILKHRLSDFQVNEITLDGTVVHITDRVIPAKEDDGPHLKHYEDDTGICEKYEKEIEQMIDSHSTKKIEINVDGLTKEQRKAIHKVLVFKYDKKVLSTTKKDNENKQFIVISLATNHKEERQQWPFYRPEYLHFALHKCNMDTTNVVGILSKQLRVKVNMIKHAGTKDKRGNTTQMISIRKYNAESVAKLSARNIWTGNYVYKSSTLKLGDLKGNRFRIALRNIKGSDEEVSIGIEMLKTHGFINYYGLQRFGSSIVSPTYAVGKSLARGDCEEAIEHILKPRPKESAFETDTDRARSAWWETRDPKIALKQLSKKNFTVEAKIIRSLAFNGPKTYVNAFQIIPRNLVLLYLHSYQSLLWNKIVSRRIKKYGLVPIVGDLVFKDLKDAPVEVIDGDENEEEDEEEKKEGEETVNTGKKLPEVETIYEENLSKYTIFDVVYPLPGCDVSYPDNEIGQWYIDLLAEDDLTSEKLSKKNKMFSLKGTYRTIVSKANDIVWSTVNHNDLDDDLLLSDIDVLNNKEPFVSVPDGSFKSLLIEFSLLPSNYATMVVREITKQDTSSHAQASLCKISRNKRDSSLPVGEENANKKIKLDVE